MPARNPGSPFDTYRFYVSCQPFQAILNYYLDISCFIVTPEGIWWSLNRHRRLTTLFDMEKKYGRTAQRNRFTRICFKQAVRERRTIVGTYLGYKDLFVPIMREGKCLAILQSGAFADSEMSSTEMGRYWKELTGQAASPVDPGYLEFVRTSLQVPVLHGKVAQAYREAMELFAGMLGGDKDYPSHSSRIRHLMYRIFSKQLPHSYWLDWALGRPTYQATPAWSRDVENWEWTRMEIGLTRVPTTVIAVIPRRTAARTADPVAEMVRIHRFQRKSFQFGRTLPETVGGRLEDYGAVFVTSVDHRQSRLQRKRYLEDLARQVERFSARELGGPVLVGVGRTVSPGNPLGESYREAVLALHLGHLSGHEKIFQEIRVASPATGIGELDRLLRQMALDFSRGSFSELALSRERLVGMILDLSWHSPGEIRWHLRYALLRVAESLVSREAEGERNVEPLLSSLDLAGTVQEMLMAFRESLDKLATFTENLQEAGKSMTLERVKGYVDGAFREPLRVTALARQAGMSVSTFSRRFKMMCGVGFETYLRVRRLTEAEQLLRDGNLPVARIGSLCGFKSVSHFIRAFHRKNRLTPKVYRVRNRDLSL